MTAVDERASDRMPPADIDIERAVLGSAMCNPDAFGAAVSAGLKAADFYLPAHEAVWEAITSLSERGLAHDALSVADEMRRLGTIRSLMSTADLSVMYEAAIPPSAGQHARSVMAYAARRKTIAAGTRITQLGWADGATPEEMQAAALEAVEGIGVPADDSTWSWLDDVLQSVHDATDYAAENGRPGGISWGYADVDREMSPMVPGEFAVLSAFSGGGKSVVACNIALHAAMEQGKTALVHAMEMTRLEVGQRWLAAQSRVELDRIINGQLRAEDFDRIARAEVKMAGAPLVVDEVETVTLATLRASIRKHKPEFVVVDQIPTMTPSDARATREQQVSALAYGLKRLAKAEHIPILACCQLNANPTRRTDRTPTMHDLRESQAIVQAANTLVILSDPMEVDKESGRMGEIDWIVRKQRQGPRDVSIPLARQFHYSRLSYLAS